MGKRWLSLVFGLFFAGASLYGDYEPIRFDLRTNGRTYHDAEFVSLKGDVLTIRHRDSQLAVPLAQVRRPLREELWQMQEKVQLRQGEIEELLGALAVGVDRAQASLLSNPGGELLTVNRLIERFEEQTAAAGNAYLRDEIDSEGYLIAVHGVTPYGALSLLSREREHTAVPFAPAGFNELVSTVTVNFLKRWQEFSSAEKIDLLQQELRAWSGAGETDFVDVFKQALREQTAGAPLEFYRMLNPRHVVPYRQYLQNWQNHFGFGDPACDLVAYYFRSYGEYAPLPKRLAMASLTVDERGRQGYERRGGLSIALTPQEQEELLQLSGQPVSVFEIDGYLFGDDFSAGRSLRDPVGYWNVVEAEPLMLLLAAVPDIGARSKQQNTLLHVAAFHGVYNAIPLLLAAGADVNARNADGQTPLMLASNAQTVLALMTAPELDAAQTDLLGRNALHYLVRLISTDPLVQYLSLVNRGLALRQLESRDYSSRLPTDILTRRDYWGGGFRQPDGESHTLFNKQMVLADFIETNRPSNPQRGNSFYRRQRTGEVLLDQASGHIYQSNKAKIDSILQRVRSLLSP